MQRSIKVFRSGAEAYWRMDLLSKELLGFLLEPLHIYLPFNSSWTAHSGILLSVDWWLVNDVSGQPIASLYKGRLVKEE
jgi:hypothetical protein